MMGREVLRVAAEFKWPLEKVWTGFLNPFSKYGRKCKVCDGSGSSPEYKRLQDLWYGHLPFKPEDRGSKPFLPENEVIMRIANHHCSRDGWYYGSDPASIEREAARLANHYNNSWSHHLNADDVATLVKSGRLMDFTHTWCRETRWQIKDPPYVPTPEEVNLWSLKGLAHDSINCWTVIRAECEKQGWPSNCVECKGEGQKWKTKRLMKKHEKWKRPSPPEGDWWQVWETVSEGSPVTPAFATAEQLIAYLVKHGDAWDQHRNEGGWDEKNAKAFVMSGFAPSMIISDGKLMTPRDMEPIEEAA